jgi:hypothetical protein
MTRKHFQMIADVVKQIEDVSIRHDTAHRFIPKLRAENSQFQASRFLTACNVEHM